MIDEFARLRTDIYLEHGSSHPHGWERLARALTGTPAEQPLDPVLDAFCGLLSHRDYSGSGFTETPPLGGSPYTDRALADRFRHRTGDSMAGKPELSGEVPTESWLRFCLSSGMTAASAPLLHRALTQRADPGLLVDACACAADAQHGELVPQIAALIDDALPWGVRLEAALALEALGAPVPSGFKAPVAALVGGGLAPRSDFGGSAAVAQSVFYGDPMRLGKGASGGLGTLVREVGGTLAQRGRPVLTLVCYDSARPDYPFEVCREVTPGHLLVRMPVFLPQRSPLGFLQAEHRIARAAHRALVATAMGAGTVGAVHVRFLDDASRAVARVAHGHGVPLVVTLTADPHRTICSADGVLPPRRAEAARELVNRVWIGDQLLEQASGVVAIGRESLARELVHYFPRLENAGSTLFAGIDEGVNTAEAPPIDAPTLLCDPRLEVPLSSLTLDRPIVLSVGRLSPVKGQVNLVRAWSRGTLHRKYNLVLVGGDRAAPSAEEKAIITAVQREIRPELEGRICHVGAQENEVIRSLLAWSAARRPSDGLDLYVCPSLKEEFGLSILEAMAAGLPVYAPLRGGPRTYIRHGVNGFLLDTRDEYTIRGELETLLGEALPDREELETLKWAARETVRTHYSLQAMAAEYEKFYRKVLTIHPSTAPATRERNQT